MRKKKILFCNDSSLYGTGFGTYTMEVLTRLSQTGKYELGEFANYGHQREETDKRLKWKYFGNQPENDNEVAIYKSRTKNQFGEWKFDDVCLKFRPDIVFVMTDVWMWDYMERSPARPYFHHVAMSTVDCEPENPTYLASYKNLDGLFCYSDYAINLLKSYGLNPIGTAPPGANLNTLFPAKYNTEAKKLLEIPEDSYILGVVMRNQQRKLYPDLVEAFKEFLQKAPKHIAEKSYLYFHTAYPDIGWDIPRLIKNSGVGNRIFFTYSCEACKLVYGSLYKHFEAVCRHCGQLKCGLPNFKKNVSPNVMGDIYRSFDCLIQYSTNGGFEMPLVEAAACGVPSFFVDYSAMSTVGRSVNGFPIEVQRFFTETVTHFKKAMPDNSDLVNKLIKFLSLPSSVRGRRGFDARKSVEENFTYEKTTKILENYFDSVEIKNKWDKPAKIFNPPLTLPDFSGMNNIEFFGWILKEVADRADLKDSFVSMTVANDLNNNVVDRQYVLGSMYTLCELKNQFERKRVAK